MIIDDWDSDSLDLFIRERKNEKGTDSCCIISWLTHSLCWFSNTSISKNSSLHLIPLIMNWCQLIIFINIFYLNWSSLLIWRTTDVNSNHSNSEEEWEFHIVTHSSILNEYFNLHTLCLKLTHQFSASNPNAFPAIPP